ncbi:MAG: hypothetical protein JWR50_2154 [Mucilaginibacter sp.]|nr:hypothetical protein [Mucilaginibacter sp.]
MPVMISSIKKISDHEVGSRKNKVSASFIMIILAPVQAANAIAVGICLMASEKNQAFANPNTR